MAKDETKVEPAAAADGPALESVAASSAPADREPGED